MESLYASCLNTSAVRQLPRSLPEKPSFSGQNLECQNVKICDVGGCYTLHTYKHTHIHTYMLTHIHWYIGRLCFDFSVVYINIGNRKKTTLSSRQHQHRSQIPHPSRQTLVTNLHLLAATETKRYYVTTKHFNLNFPQQCNLKVYSRWLWIFLSLKSPEEWAIAKQAFRDESV